MKILSLFICLFFLSACEFAGIIGNGFQRLYTVIDDDRSGEDDIQDFQINSSVRSALTALKPALLFDVEVTVFEGEVLLTGTVPNGEVINRILTAVWSVDGVKKIYNYVRTDATPNMTDIADETAIASTIKSKLALTLGVSSSNYKITLEHGTVYLMGICSSDSEYARVQSVLKSTNGVDKIIFLMRIKHPSEPPQDFPSI